MVKRSLRERWAVLQYGFSLSIKIPVEVSHLCHVSIIITIKWKGKIY